MLELRTFGGLSLTADGAPTSGAGARRKTLALLALLAISKKGLSRDKLIAYLWPETDSERGRNLLKQACFALRRDLRQPELFLGATELSLNSAVITSDVHSFEDALQRGDPAAAVALYAGAFLDGFFLSDVSEFEQWVEGERGRLARRYHEALEALARAAAERGEHRAAADWWRRLTVADPLSARAVIGLMTALDEAGESAEAIRQGQAHEAFVRAELGAEPPSEVAALVGQLQRQSTDERPSGRPGPALPKPAGEFSVPVAGVPVTLLERVHQARTLSLVAVAAVVVLLAGGTVYALLRSDATADPRDPVAVPGRKLLVVLPFANRGATEDEYFADGLSEAIAARLGSIQRLGVIAWPSASQYKDTRKSPQEIGRELGVQYILEGSVRWEKRPGTSGVRVSPMLIRVSDGVQLWAAQYDTTLTGVFAVQSTLATRVAGALDIALGDAERQLLDRRATTNLQAYDLYLRGRELVDREFLVPSDVRAATKLYERAVALDSNFALAYAWLSTGLTWLHYHNMDLSPEQVTRAKAALDRALRLDPTLPESHAALGFYYYHVTEDNGQALAEFIRARRLRPNDPWLPNVIGEIYRSQGRWNQALAYHQEAVLLDPRNALITMDVGNTYSYVRRFSPAMYYYDRALALRPQSFDGQLGKALAYLGQTGDLAGAQRLFPDLSQPLDPLANWVPILSFVDVATLLDASRQGQLLKLAPVAIEGDSAVLALAKGMVQRTLGHRPEARVQFDSARALLEPKTRQEPDNDYFAAQLGLAMAGLGRSAEAIREGERALSLVPVSKDAEENAYLQANLARIYVLLVRNDLALEQLEIVLSRPGPLSAGWLRADPFWDPLRADPKFQRLVAARN